MKFILKKILTLVFFFIIISCTNNNKVSSNKTHKPSWLSSLDGYQNGRLVATECANVHVKGFEAQKELALQRASSTLAMQKNTKVKTISNSSEKRNKGVLGSSTYTRHSEYSTNTNISFKIKEEYYDKLNKNYCVLIEG